VAEVLDLQGALEGAERAALAEGAPEVLPAHLLQALVEQRPGALAAIFAKAKLDQAALGKALPKVAYGAKTERAPDGEPAPEKPLAPASKGPLAPSPELAAALARASHEAGRAGRARPSPADALLALAEDTASETGRILAGRFGITRTAIEAALHGKNGGAAKKGAAAETTGPPDLSREPGHPPAPHLGMGLAGLVGELDVKVRMLEARLEGERRRSARRLSLAFFLILVLAVAVGYIYVTAPLPHPFGQ